MREVEECYQQSWNDLNRILLFAWGKKTFIISMLPNAQNNLTIIRHFLSKTFVHLGIVNSTRLNFIQIFNWYAVSSMLNKSAHSKLIYIQLICWYFCFQMFKSLLPPYLVLFKNILFVGNCFVSFKIKVTKNMTSSCKVYQYFTRITKTKIAMCAQLI